MEDIWLEITTEYPIIDWQKGTLAEFYVQFWSLFSEQDQVVLSDSVRYRTNLKKKSNIKI